MRLAIAAFPSIAHGAWNFAGRLARIAEFRREVEKGRTSAREDRVLDHDEVVNRIDQRYRSYARQRSD